MRCTHTLRPLLLQRGANIPLYTRVLQKTPHAININAITYNGIDASRHRCLATTSTQILDGEKKVGKKEDGYSEEKSYDHASRGFLELQRKGVEAGLRSVMVVVAFLVGMWSLAQFNQEVLEKMCLKRLSSLISREVSSSSKNILIYFNGLMIACTGTLLEEERKVRVIGAIVEELRAIKSLREEQMDHTVGQNTALCLLYTMTCIFSFSVGDSRFSGSVIDKHLSDIYATFPSLFDSSQIINVVTIMTSLTNCDHDDLLNGFRERRTTLMSHMGGLFVAVQATQNDESPADACQIFVSLAEVFDHVNTPTAPLCIRQHYDDKEDDDDEDESDADLLHDKSLSTPTEKEIMLEQEVFMECVSAMINHQHITLRAIKAYQRALALEDVTDELFTEVGTVFGDQYYCGKALYAAARAIDDKRVYVTPKDAHVVHALRQTLKRDVEPVWESTMLGGGDVMAKLWLCANDMIDGAAISVPAAFVYGAVRTAIRERRINKRMPLGASRPKLPWLRGGLLPMCGMVVVEGVFCFMSYPNNIWRDLYSEYLTKLFVLRYVMVSAPFSIGAFISSALLTAVASTEIELGD